MAYRVIRHFVDLQDNNYSYGVGDVFPHAGVNVSDARIAELAGSDNKQGVPLIEKVRSRKEEPVVEENVEEAPKKKRAKKTAEE